MMNNRLQALANDAELYVDLYGRPYPRAMSAEEADAAYEKYAKLIVGECADFIEQDQGTGEVLSSRLKEHFGVEQ